ncbi:MAG: tyrosine-type recombinase/integrase [Spirochaetales bacterium]|nr:tyrosine-type recombinase/integrase [Spirochaetales bacterium]
MDIKQKKIYLEFLEAEKVSGRMERGINQLKRTVPKLFSYLLYFGFEFSEIGVKEALFYQKWLLETGRLDGDSYKSSTVRNYLNGAISFYEYLKRKKLVYENPFKQIKLIREDKILPRNILKEKQMDDLLTELTLYNTEPGVKNQKTMYRIHVMAELMYSTGLRISEVAGLKCADIDFQRGIVNVINGKGGYSRIAWLGDYSREILKIYITQMRELTFSFSHEKNDDLLFGTPWYSMNRIINKTLKKVSNRLEFGNFTSHGFRHALGYHLLRAGCSIRYIQEILGHKRIRNTEIYTKVDRENLRDVLDNFHPRRFRSK